MAKFLSYLLVGLAMFSAVHSLIEFRAALAFKAAKSAAARTEVSGLSAVALKERQAAALSRAIEATEVSGRSRETYSHLASVLNTLAEGEPRSDVAINLRCQTLAAVSQGLVSKPFNSGLLANWANIRQLLADVSCGLPSTEGDYRAVVSQALKSDPGNVSVMYAGALISLWSGDRASALKLLNKFLTFSTLITEGQRESILALLGSDQDLIDVLPARFPTVVQWSNLILTKLPYHFKELRAGLAEVQLAALALNDLEYEQVKISADLYQRRLLQLLPLVASSTVRSKIDAELARFVQTEDNRKLSDYLRYRSELTSLDSLVSVVLADTKPKRSQISGWSDQLNDGSRQVSFDEYYTSIGIFVPIGQVVQLFQLQATRESVDLVPAKIELFGSQDNEQWEDLSGRFEVESVGYLGGSIISIKPVSTGYQYWKIHFAGSDRPRTFSNSLSQLVAVFGYAQTSPTGNSEQSKAGASTS